MTAAPTRRGIASVQNSDRRVVIRLCRKRVKKNLPVSYPHMTSYPWISYAAAHAHEAEARRLDVSHVARSDRGFMREYERAGSARAMRDRPLPDGVVGGDTWGQKRHGFIARHLAKYREHPTYRRYLALLMWAYAAPPPVRRGLGRDDGTRRRSRTRRSQGPRRDAASAGSDRARR